MSKHLTEYNLVFIQVAIIKRFLLWIILVMAGPSHLFAVDLTTEEKVKASYIFNFIRFVKWPVQKITSDTSFNVCAFARNDNFIQAFRPVIGRKINDRAIALHRLDTTEKIAHCHLLYLGEARLSRHHEFLYQAGQQGILTVSDIHQFCQLGGIIGMVTRDGKVRIEINLSKAQEFGFHISSNLLEVSTLVSDS